MNLKENNSRSLEVLAAYWRQGAKEIGNALYGPGTAAASSEYGMAMTRTPGQVADGLRGEASTEPSCSDAEPSIIDRYTQPAPEAEPGRDERTRESPEMERD